MRPPDLELAVMVQLNKQILDENERLSVSGEELIIPQKLQTKFKHQVVETPAYLAYLDLLAIRFDQHKQSLPELEARYITNLESGLSSVEAEIRLKRRGYNIITVVSLPSSVTRLAHFLFSSTNGLIIGAMGCLIVGYFLSAARPIWTLWILIPLTFTVGLTTHSSHYRMSRSNELGSAPENLRLLTNHSVTVVRDGVEIPLKATHLVSGDICLLSANQRVPADIRVITGEVSVDQSLLTGIRLPVVKSVSATVSSPFEAENLLFLGTTVTGGSCRGLVLHCGNKSTVAKLSRQIKEHRGHKTSLFLDLRYFYKATIGFAVTMGLIFGFVGMWTVTQPGSNYSVSEVGGAALLVAASVAIATIPLLFNSILVLGLHIAERAVKKTGAFLAKLDLVNSYASISVLALGNKAQLVRESDRSVSGVWRWNGDAHTLEACEFTDDTDQSLLQGIQATVMPEARRTADDRVVQAWLDSKALPPPAVDEIDMIGYVVSARIEGVGVCLKGPLHEVCVIVGETLDNDPVIVPLLQGGHTLIGIGITREDGHSYLLGVLAISNPVSSGTLRAVSVLRRMGIQLMPLFDCAEGPDPEAFVASLVQRAGIVDSLQDSSSGVGASVMGLDLPEPSTGSSGRVYIGKDQYIDFGVLDATSEHPASPVSDKESDTLSASASRPTSPEYCLVPKRVVASMRLATRSSGQFGRLSLSGGNALMVSGTALDGMSLRELRESVLEKQVVFFNLSFVQKLRVVIQLKRRIVHGTIAFIGSVNADAPALRSANLGIATSGEGVVGRVSDVRIIRGDTLGCIAKSILESRRSVNNLRRAFIFLIAQITPRLMALFVAIAFACPLPLSTVLIVAGSLVVDSFPAAGLLMEPTEYDVGYRIPRSEARERLISQRMLLISVAFLGLLGAMSGFLGFNQVMSDYGFDPAGLPGFTTAAFVLLEPASTAEPGFPITTGYPLALELDLLTGVHLCGRVGSVGTTFDDLLEVPLTHRCDGPVFTLDSFNAFCFSMNPDETYSVHAAALVSLYTEQKQIAGVLFQRDPNNDGLPICGQVSYDGVYVPYGFYTTSNQHIVDRAMKDYPCSSGETLGDDGLPICFTNDVLRYGQTVYFASVSFFAILSAILIVRTEIFSFFHVGPMRANWFVIIGCITSLTIVLFIIYIPGMHHGLGTRPLDMSNLFTPAMPFIILAFVIEESRKYYIRTNTQFGRWLMKRTMW